MIHGYGDFLFFILTTLAPLLIVLGLLENQKEKNMYCQKQFKLFYKKVVFLNKKNEKYEANFILKKAWDLLKREVYKNNEYVFWEFVTLFVWSLFYLFLIILTINDDTAILKREDKTGLKAFQMIFYGSLFSCFVVLTLYYLFSYLSVRKKMSSVESILNKWVFVQDSLCFDTNYLAQKTLVKNLYIEIKTNSTIFKSRKNKFEKIWFFEFTKNLQNYQEIFMMSYLLIWGMHYNLDFVKNTNYKEIYQNFVNLYQGQINELSTE